MARLLIVDDDPDQIEIRRLILEQAGHEVLSAPDPASAIDAFDHGQPALILMDLRLPRPADGIRLLRTLRARSSTVRIIVLSGWPEDIVNSGEAGMADHVLRKPVRSRELLGLINRVA